MLILAIQAFRESIDALKSAGHNVDGVIDQAFKSRQSPLLDFFHRLNSLKPGSVVRVPPGMIHAAGPGMYLVEASHDSDNTFRVFDYGREFDPLQGRDTHYTLAAAVLSDESIVDEGVELRHVRHQWSPDLSGNIDLKVFTAQELAQEKRIEIPVKSGHAVLCTST